MTPPRFDYDDRAAGANVFAQLIAHGAEATEPGARVLWIDGYRRHDHQAPQVEGARENGGVCHTPYLVRPRAVLGDFAGQIDLDQDAWARARFDGTGVEARHQID